MSGDGYSGGGFSEIFLRPMYQEDAVTRFLENFDGNRGLFKYARCLAPIRFCDLTYAYFVICVALRVVATQTSPPKE
jgi:subtilase family serine protease